MARYNIKNNLKLVRNQENNVKHSQNFCFFFNSNFQQLRFVSHKLLTHHFYSNMFNKNSKPTKYTSDQFIMTKELNQHLFNDKFKLKNPGIYFPAHSHVTHGTHAEYNGDMFFGFTPITTNRAATTGLIGAFHRDTIPKRPKIV